MTSKWRGDPGLDSDPQTDAGIAEGLATELGEDVGVLIFEAPADEEVQR